MRNKGSSRSSEKSRTARTRKGATTGTRKPRNNQTKRTPRNRNIDKYIQEPVELSKKKRNGNPFVRWVNTHVDNVRLGLGILIFLCSLLILNNNLNIKDAYITSGQSFYSVLLMGKSTNDLTSWAREYVVTGDVKYKQEYDNHLEERSGRKPDRHGITKSYDKRFNDIPNNIVPDTDKQKLLDSLSASDTLADIEKNAFEIVEDGDLESAEKLVFGKEYDKHKEAVVNPLLEFTDKMRTDIGKRIVTKVYFSYAYIIILCLANLLLIILINDRLDLSIKDEEE